MATTKKHEPTPIVESMSVRELIFKRLERLSWLTQVKSQDNLDGTVTLLVTLNEGEEWPKT
jgi:hypothetical protein